MYWLGLGALLIAIVVTFVLGAKATIDMGHQMHDEIFDNIAQKEKVKVVVPLDTPIEDVREIGCALLLGTRPVTWTHDITINEFKHDGIDQKYRVYTIEEG
jgi:hypothetical protein